MRIPFFRRSIGRRSPLILQILHDRFGPLMVCFKPPRRHGGFPEVDQGLRAHAGRSDGAPYCFTSFFMVTYISTYFLPKKQVSLSEYRQ